MNQVFFKKFDIPIKIRLEFGINWTRVEHITKRVEFEFYATWLEVY